MSVGRFAEVVSRAAVARPAMPSPLTSRPTAGGAIPRRRPGEASGTVNAMGGFSHSEAGSEYRENPRIAAGSAPMTTQLLNTRMPGMTEPTGPSERPLHVELAALRGRIDTLREVLEDLRERRGRAGAFDALGSDLENDLKQRYAACVAQFKALTFAQTPPAPATSAATVAGVAPPPVQIEPKRATPLYTNAVPSPPASSQPENAVFTYTHEARPRRPSRVSEAVAQWARQVVSAGAATRSELAIHGLAYLGVALTFVGALGFVLFAYGSVSPTLRTAALLVIPVFLFAAAGFLYGRGTTLVPASLEFLAGAITPVTLFAALGGIGTVATPLMRAGLGIALASLYFASSVRRPTAPIRYLVVPMLWVAAWALGLLIAKGGYSAWQVAVTSGAITVSLAAIRLRPSNLLAHPTNVAARFGVAVTFLLAVVFTVSDNGAAIPVALIGLACLVSLNLAVDRRSGTWLSFVETLLLAATLALLIPTWGTPRVGAIAVVAALTLIEWQQRMRPNAMATSLLAALAGTGLMLSLGEPSAALIAGTLAAVWLHAPRLRAPAAVRGLSARRLGRIGLATLAGAVPAVPMVALLQLVAPPRALLVVSALFLVVTAGVRWLRVRDVLYDTWLPAVAVAISAATGVMFSAPSAELAAAAVLAGLILAAAPAWPVVRIC